MKERQPWDFYAAIAKSLNREKVDYLFIGAVGINLYAKLPGQVVTTQDLDIFIRPEWNHWSRSLEALKKIGFAFEAAGEPLEGLSAAELKRVFKQRVGLQGIRKDTAVDLVLEMQGFSFDEAYKGRRVFKVGRIPLHVASLPALLESKRLVGREKDRLFLATYKDKVKEILSVEKRAKRKRKP